MDRKRVKGIFLVRGHKEDRAPGHHLPDLCSEGDAVGLWHPDVKDRKVDRMVIQITESFPCAHKAHHFIDLRQVFALFHGECHRSGIVVHTNRFHRAAPSVLAFPFDSCILAHFRLIAMAGVKNGRER